jgi:hypothetical protein
VAIAASEAGVAQIGRNSIPERVHFAKAVPNSLF